MRVALISCVKSKRAGRHRARNLYTSPLFRFSLAYVSRHYDAVYILSAKHGLIHPDQLIQSYDTTLRGMPIRERRRWADRVAVQLFRALPFYTELHFFCGKRYREFLQECLGAWPKRVPLKGLGLGQQIQWYKNRIPS